MSIKFEKIHAGMTLYDRHRHVMGNTTMTDLGEWPVRVLEVDAANGCATVSWNGNRPETWCRRRLVKLWTWSMYDETECERTEGWLGRTTRVRRLSKKEREARQAQTAGAVSEVKP